MKQKKQQPTDLHTTHDEKQAEQQITQIESDPRFIQTAEEFYNASQFQQSEISTEQQQTFDAQEVKLSIKPQPVQCEINSIQERFFRDIPSENIEIRYYIDHLITQTPVSSSIREHIRENFAQYKHFKTNLLPRLSQIQVEKIELAQPKEKQGWKTLVLDLDETLLHCMDDFQDSSSGMNSLHDIQLTPSPDSSPLVLQVSLRPGVFDFLSKATQLFEIILFTASEKSYAMRAMDLINQQGQIDAFLSREDCVTLSSDEFIKDLSILNRDDILIVDNSLIAVRQTEALIPIIPYYGDEADTQLKELMPYLRELSQANKMIEVNKQQFLWDQFQNAKTCSEYFREIRKIKSQTQDQ